ncbi:predicted protein [Lichtheimia corymbifera JMRC:FSU:9682]|uniref:DDT domain-containing protein n=1 Tax=Lichtheimia corymbifera JMRC:FSU:9682 TaxID=1263082 RepID=A0A068RPI1_9FUNG|nr:predicted protein [Lichtheimia corymbifera JMRC:FSU:9682]
MKRSHIDSKDNTHSKQQTEKANSQHGITGGKENVHLQPGIQVTNASTPEAMLHSSWKFLYSYHFLSLFASALHISSLKLDTLESAMLTSLPSTNTGNGLLRTMSSMLADDFTENCNINHETDTQRFHHLVENIIQSLFDASRLRHKNSKSNGHLALYEHLSETTPISIPKESWSFWELDLLGRIHALKWLIDQVDWQHLQSWQVGMAEDKMRLTPLGTDRQGWTYWMFDDTRLYRELPMNLLQRKTIALLESTDYTFELVCRTIDDWKELKSRFSTTSRKPAEKALALNLETIVPEAIQRLEALQLKKEREEARRERARQLEALPRKRSRRLEAKENELNKRRKVKEVEEQRMAMQVFEQQQAVQQKSHDEHLLKDVERGLKKYIHDHIQEEIDRILEEDTAALEKDEGDLADKIRSTRRSPAVRHNPRLAFLRDLDEVLSKKAGIEQRVEKMRGWATLLDDQHGVKVSRGDNPDAPLVLGYGLKLDGPGTKGDITSPILKNILRVFLTTLPSASNDTGMDIPTIRRKLLLGDYKKQGQFSGFESFIQDLDLALPHSSSKAAFSPQAHAAEILVRIFS